MTFELHEDGFPGRAASAINAGAAVAANIGDVQRSFVPVGSGISAVEPFGIAVGTAAAGEAVTIQDDPGAVIKVPAGASLGHGADVGVGSTNGALFPVAGASGVVVWRVGKALSAAAAGETFSLYVSPRQLSGEA